MLAHARGSDPEPSDWLREQFPEVAPSFGWGGDPCWLAWALNQTAEHNPPMYWLGRAFEVVDRAGQVELFGERLRAAHGAASCGATGDRDDRLQDVLTELCAFAWTAERIAVPTIEPAAEGGSQSVGPIRLVVPEARAVVLPRRLQPQNTIERVLYQVAGLAEDAARASGGLEAIFYLDVWHERRYAQSVGYRFELTEPVREALRHFATEFGMGYVLTRPFEWGRALEEWF
ncbi:MAG: hypothetical protein AB7F65_09165 [Dehalococcoidia bacterium]